MTESQQNARERINGVFSSQEVRKVGVGATTRKTIQKTFWFCGERSDGLIESQPLNANYVPSGPKKTFTLDAFLARFSPEPEVYVTTVYPRMRELGRTVARADRHRKSKEYYSAEMEYGQALKVDEENVRANFGLGITYLERGNVSKAENIFERLVRLEAAFEDEHKHLFNEFGIQLRKNGMIDQAVTYYERALALATRDENLFYNMARAILEKKDFSRALEYLLKALALNPTLEPAAKLLFWMVSNRLVPASARAEADAALLKVGQTMDEERPPAPHPADAAPEEPEPLQTGAQNGKGA